MGQRLMSRSVVVGASAAAILAAGLAGAVPPANAVGHADAAGDAAPAGSVAAIDTLGPIPVSTPTGSSVMPPRPVQVAVLPSGSVLAGTDVRLYSRELKDVASVPVRVIDLVATAGDPNPNPLWTGTLADGWGRLTTALTGGRTYAVEAQGLSGWVGIGSLTARTASDAGGPQTAVGSLMVNQVLGTVSWGWTSRALVGPNGGLSVGLGFTPGDAAPRDLPRVPGLPGGWRLGVDTGSPWMGIVTSAKTTTRVGAPEGVDVRPAADGRVHIDVANDPSTVQRWDDVAVRVQREDGSWSDAQVEPAARALDGFTLDVPADAVALQVGAIADGQTLWAAPVSPDGTTTRRAAARRTAEARARQALPAAVRVVGWDGSVLVFERNDLGAYEQRTGAGAAGYENVLTRRADGTWTFTDIRGVVTTFANDRVASVSVDGQPLSRVTWDAQGRVTSVRNETSNVIDLVYADQNACPSQGWTASGFAAVPNGMLCQVRYPGGLATDIGYASGMSGGPQLALIKDPGNRGTAIGWDTAGRLVSTRSSLLARTATVDGTVRAAVATLLDRVEYDAQGRASRLIAGPARVGGAPMVRTVAFPVVTDTVLRSFVADPTPANGVTTSVGLAAGQPSDVRLTSIIDPITWRVLQSRDAAGLATRLNTDPRTGAVESTRNAQGLVTKVETNSLGLPVSVQGPFTGTGEGGLRTKTSYDTAIVRGKDVAVNGWRVTVRQPGKESSGFWPARASNGLSAAWANVGTDWATTASAVWDPSTGETTTRPKNPLKGHRSAGWAFQVTSAGGARVQFTVDGIPCVPDQMGICAITGLRTGPKAVMMRVDRAPSSGWFDVQVAPVTKGAQGALVIGTFATVPQADVTPGFNNTTRAAVNDTFRGSAADPATVQVFDNPASGRPSEVTYVGDLTEKFRYETGGWGRLLERTTPGGEQVVTSYWPTTGTTTTPDVCGAQTVPLLGLVRSVTRQDGSVITYFHDVSGRLVASQTRDDKGAILETGCSAFRDDDSQKSSRVFNAKGELLESIATQASAGGDPRVTVTTITKGAGAPVGAGASVTTTARVDLHGKIVDSTDAAGVRTQTTYDDLERPTSVVVTPPAGSAATPLTFGYSYRSRDSQVAAVTVNGVDATRVSYDPATGQIASFTYAGGAAAMSLGRFGNGSINRVTVTSGSTRFTSSADLTPAGRITGHTTAATGEVSFTETRAYRYDEATRLSSATITSNQAGVAPSTEFTYAFGSQSATCGTAYAAAGKDGLRTSGSRSGTAYVTCYDGKGRAVSTTDPLVTGGTGTAALSHDALGRVTAVTGVARPLQFTWGVGGEVAIMREAIDTTTPITTTLETYAGAVLRKTVTSAAGTSRLVYAGPWNLTQDDSGALAGVESLQYSLPGGAIVTIPAGGTAMLQLPGVDGSALASIPVPTLGAGGTVPPIAAADRFGPFGEPLAARQLAPATARPTYGWQGAAGVETLAGSSAVALMGARAYSPALGQFLSPDPQVDAGNNVYSYTSGDPVNSSDLPGTEEQTDMYVLVGAAVATLLSGLLLIRSSGVTSVIGAVLGLGAAGAGAYVAVKSFSNNDTLMGSLAAAVAVAGLATGAVNIYKAVGHFKAWRASRAAQKAQGQQQAADVVPTDQDALAEYIRAEAMKMRQAEAQVAQPQATSAPKLPDWAGHLDQGNAPSTYLTTAPPGKMTLNEINTMRFQDPGDGMAWFFDKTAQRMGALDEFTFQVYSAEGRVVSRYNNIIVVI